MADVRPKDFTTATVWPSSMKFYFQPSSGSELQVPETLLYEKLEELGFLKSPTSASISDGSSIAIDEGQLVLAIIVQVASGTPTLSVGTTSGGTDIVDNAVLATGVNPAFIVHTFFLSSGALHFTLSAGSITVFVKKI